MYELEDAIAQVDRILTRKDWGRDLEEGAHIPKKDTKAAHIERAAVNFRVKVNKAKKATIDQAYDAIAETTHGSPKWTISANEVLNAAKKMG